jgi:tetratricopeptide (TPR) repeat protein
VESARAVCADTDDELAILQPLAGLIDKSLLRMRDDGGEPRLTMLEILREYGLERLQAAGAFEMLGRRHAAHFLALAESAEPELTGRRQVESMARLHREYDNLRAALEWARENDAAGTGLRLAGALQRFWSSSSYLSEGRRWIEEMLLVSVDDSEMSPEVQIKALVGAATLAIDQGMLDEAGPLCAESVALARTHGSARNLVLALNTQGLWARQTARYEEAREHYQAALDLAQREGDRAGAAAALGGLAVLASFSGEFPTAIALADRSLGLFRELGDIRSTAEALNGMALQYELLAQYDRAESLARESLDLYRSLNDAGGVAATLFTLATLALQRGEYQKAAPFLEESFTLREKRGDRHSAAMSLSALSAVALNRGDTVEARRLIIEALNTLERYDDPWAIAISRTLLGHVELDAGHMQQAQMLFAEAAATFLEMGNLLYLPWALDGMAEVAAARGEWELAGQFYGVREATHLGMTGSLVPLTQSATQRAMAATREALGEDRFAAAKARGRECPIDSMIGEALAALAHEAPAAE